MELKAESWENLFNKFYETYALGEARDPGYALIAKLFTYISDSWQLFVIFGSGVYFVALYKFLTRYVDTLQGMLLAFTFCISLFHIIPLSGMRQQFTMAIAMLLPPLIEEKKLVKFLVVVLIGSTIHLSLIFVLPLYFLYHYFSGNSKLFIIVSFICMPVIAISAKSILTFLVSSLSSDYYTLYLNSEQSGAFLYIIFFALIVLVTIIYYNKVNLKSQKLYCSALMMISLTVPLIIVDGAMIRIGQYFTIYSMLFLPYVIQHSKNKILLYSIIGALLYLTISNSFEYHFFWEDIPIIFR